jgi:uncharacterized protein (TIGR01319 family)
MDKITIRAKSILAVDIGSTLTRALFFDVVSGGYRFLASASSTTTFGAPLFDVTEGIWLALEELQNITGRNFLDDPKGVIIPSTKDNQGADIMVVTISAGNPISVVTVGLLDNISLQNAQYLARTTYAKLRAEISLNDRKTPSERINLITAKRPDLIIIAGGTNDGATHSLINILESIGLASFLMDESQRPHVLYAGNEELHDEVRSGIGNISKLRIAPNILPVIGKDNINPAQREINDIFMEIRRNQTGGMKDLLSWTEGDFSSTASALGRVIRFLSEKYEPEKGVMGVDIGSEAVIIAAGFKGQEVLRVFPSLGVGGGALGVFEESSIEEIKRWMLIDLPDDEIRDYIYNKAANPATLPTLEKHLEIEIALAKQALRIAVKNTIPSLSKYSRNEGSLLPVLEPIIGSGRILTHAPNLSQVMSILLDGLQPTGVTTLALDQYGLMPGLGATAEVNPLLTVQVIESNIFQNIGTIIAPIGYARPGTTVLRIRIIREDGRSFTRDIKFGTLSVLPVDFGEKVSLHIRPLHKFDIGMGGSGKAGKVNAVGGALGIVIDARGRPLQFYPDHEKNWKRNQAWRKILQKHE